MTAAFGLAARVRSRLRNKLALAMVLTSLAPLIAAGAIAAWLVVGRLERGLGDQAVETAKIAVNLLLRQAESAARETKQLAASAELHEMLSEAPGRVPRFLRREARRMSAGMVEISDGRGKILGRASPSPARYRPVRSTRESAALGRALGFRRYLSIERVDGRLVHRVGLGGYADERSAGRALERIPADLLVGLAPAVVPVRP